MQVLLLMAHADDETLGAGGWVQKLIADGHGVQLITVSDCVVALRDRASDNRSALQQALEVLSIREHSRIGLPDQRFEETPVAALARMISQQITAPPDLILTHSSGDLNRDHRQVSEAARIIGRPRGRAVSILGCEIPCVSAWNGIPFPAQLYVDIGPYIETKIRAFACYEEEVKVFPDPYSAEGLRTLARFRGMESGHTAAEAFEVIRWDAGLRL